MNVRKHRIDSTELTMALFVTLSFCIQIYTHILVSDAILIASLFVVTLAIVFLNNHREQYYLLITTIWLMALIVIAISMVRPSEYILHFSIRKYVDLFAVLAGISIIIFSGDNCRSFRLSGKIILFFALFFAFSIWVQKFSPIMYQNYLMLLPHWAQEKIVALVPNYYTGFSSNPAFTANHIIVGILWALSTRYENVKLKYKRYLVVVFLLISLFMTGKRAQLLSLLISILAVYLIPSKGKFLSKKIINIVLIFAGLFTLFLLSKNLIVEIPVFGRLYKSVISYASGADITSGRVPLYEHAWNQFLSNPLFGLGWGNYRFTTIGNVTIQTEMEVHNIYLQLLAETGLIGFIFIIFPFVAFLLLTMNSIRKFTCRHDNMNWYNVLMFSLGYQIYFLLLGLTENVLYDANYVMVYFFSCSIITTYQRSRVFNTIKDFKTKNITNRKKYEIFL